MACPPPFDDYRHQRQHHYAENQRREVCAYLWQIAEEIAGIQKQANPRHSTRDVIAEKARIVHAAHTSGKRHKGTDDGRKAGQYHGASTVFGEELLCPQQVITPEPPGVRIAEQVRAEVPAYRIVDGIAEYRRTDQRQRHRVHVETGAGDQGAGGE